MKKQDKTAEVVIARGRLKYSFTNISMETSRQKEVCNYKLKLGE
jgi:hypothetical protein